MMQFSKASISLLFVLLLIVSTSRAYAQRQPNLSLAHYWGKTEGTITFIKDNDNIVIDGSSNAGTYFLQWRIVNSGATPNDTIAVSDTVKIQTLWTTYRVQWGQGQFPKGMKQQDTVFITPATNPVAIPLPQGLTSSQDSIVTQWCDSVYFVSGDGTNPAIEADAAENIVCDTVRVTYWRTAIEDVIGGNGILLYPNPASTTLMIKWTHAIGNSCLQIVDASGKTVYQDSLGDNEREHRIDLAAFSAGLYFLRVNTPTTTVSEKFFVK